MNTDNSGISDDASRAREARRVEHAKRAVAILQGMNVGAANDFLRHWIAFNAIYNLFYHNNEREALRECIYSSIDEKSALDLLIELSEEIKFLAALPPGNMRRHPSHELFRKRGIDDMERVVDASTSPSVRLSYLVAVVYQIRCNLVHGMKGLMGNRDQELVRVGNSVVGKVLKVLLDNTRPAANPVAQADG